MTIITGLLWFCAIGCGLIAGVFFAFSAFIMTSLGRVDQNAGIAVMNAINQDIVKSAFLAVFMATTVASLVVVALAFLRWGEPGSFPVLVGGALWVLGVFVVTVVFNVPLNNALAAVDLAGADAAPLWTTYLKEWTFWNHIRMTASIIGTGFFIGAIAVA
jgi:uncharacterized membrane protein